MITRCKTLARSAIGQAGGTIYLVATAYILVPMAFSLVIGMQVNVPQEMLFLEPTEMLSRLAEMLNPAQMAYLAVGSVITSLVSMFLSYGFTFCTLKAARYEPISFNDLFAGFKTPGRVFLANVIIYFKMLAWSIITFIPILVLGVVAVYYISSTRVGILVGVWITVVVALLPFLLINMRYEQALRILADDPMVSASEAVRLSVEMMRGNGLKLFSLRLSFILWYFLESMTRGITGVYSKPYLMCSEAAFYDEISSGFVIRPEGTSGGERRFENAKQDFDSLR